MSVEEVGKAASVGAEVGWPGREGRFGFFVRHPFCEALVAEVDGEVVGVGFGTRNGAVGWIGLVCVSPRYGRRGVGAALTAGVAERLERSGCRTLVLTATGMGQPLYERLGFSAETLYLGFVGPGLGEEALDPGLRQMAPGDVAAVCDLDLRLTGEDRSHLLRTFGEQGWVVVGEDGEVRGHHVPVPWGGGPVIAADPEAARALVHLVRVLAGPDGTARFWLAEGNGEGLEHMRRIGFEEERRLPRMVRGEPLPWRPGSLWGVFSLAKG